MAKSSTTWTAGMPSPNPGGRSKATSAVARLILDKTKNGEELVDGLLAIFRGKKTDPRTKIHAAKELFDRCVGRATQTLDVRVDEEKPERSIKDIVDSMTPEQLAALEVLAAMDASGSSTEH